MVSEEGKPIKIIYPGRATDDQGADFRDAVIASGRELIKGDIEVHVKSSDWQNHGHHHDRIYNRVILHVVMWHDINKTATNLENGENIPIIVLNKYIKNQISQPHRAGSLNMPCLKASEHLPTDFKAEFLDSAGEKRFLAKAAKFQAELAQTEASQVLYQGIMGALGYSKNKLPFLKLARGLPLQILESVTQGKISDEECLARQQALLLGTAGLLPPQRLDSSQSNKLEDKWGDKLKRLWGSFHLTETMSPCAWHLFKVRPNNFPIRRLVAMSYLILRYREKGLFEELVNMVKEVPLSQGHRRLEKGLMVTADGYWASHLDFGLTSKVRNPTLLGNRRAADIAVNVLLPFTFAWGKVTSQPQTESKAFNLYHCYPKLVKNTIERHMMNQLGLSDSLVNSAQRQQGLIHIYKSLCTQGRCNCCSLGAV
ncbi:hypothetical protein ES703_84919 [subsurface metagenome]